MTASARLILPHVFNGPLYNGGRDMLPPRIITGCVGDVLPAADPTTSPTLITITPSSTTTETTPATLQARGGVWRNPDAQPVAPTATTTPSSTTPEQACTLFQACAGVLSILDAYGNPVDLPTSIPAFPFPEKTAAALQARGGVWRNPDVQPIAPTTTTLSATPEQTCTLFQACGGVLRVLDAYGNPVDLPTSIPASAFFPEQSIAIIQARDEKGHQLDPDDNPVDPTTPSSTTSEKETLATLQARQFVGRKPAGRPLSSLSGGMYRDLYSNSDNPRSDYHPDFTEEELMLYLKRWYNQRQEDLAKAQPTMTRLPPRPPNYYRSHPDEKEWFHRNYWAIMDRLQDILERIKHNEGLQTTHDWDPSRLEDMYDDKYIPMPWQQIPAPQEEAALDRRDLPEPENEDDGKSELQPDTELTEEDMMMLVEMAVMDVALAAMAENEEAKQEETEKEAFAMEGTESTEDAPPEPQPDTPQNSQTNRGELVKGNALVALLVTFVFGLVI